MQFDDKIHQGIQNIMQNKNLNLIKEVFAEKDV